MSKRGRFWAAWLVTTVTGSMFACGGGSGGGDGGNGPASSDGGEAGIASDAADDGSAVDPRCSNGTKDGSETDVDCGGQCAQCAAGKACKVDDDCSAGDCKAGICVSTTACQASGFCWENPTPTGDSLLASTGTSANDVWIVGPKENAFHWDGGSLVPVRVPAPSFLAAAHALDATHVWAVGGVGGIVFWDGTKWSAQTSGTQSELRAVWAVSANDVWAAGGKNVVLHFDGSAWKAVTTPSAFGPEIFGVYAANATDVWIAGYDGTLSKWNGSSFDAEPIGDAGAVKFTSLWGRGANVWAGSSSAIYARNGGGWSSQASGLPSTVRNGFALDATHAFAAGNGVLFRFDGTWSSEVRSGDVQHVWGTSANDLWMVGPRTIDHYDGAGWKAHVRALDLPGKLSAVAASDPDDVVAVGDSGLVLRRQAGTWLREDVPSAEDLAAVWTGGKSATVAVGRSIWRRNGTIWAKESVPGVSGSSANWSAITGLGPTNQWVGHSDGRIAHFDGATWTLDATANDKALYGMFALDAANVWAVGQSGTILHFDGTKWASEASGTTSELRAVWAASTNDVWAVGNGAAVLRRVGGVWQVQPSFGDRNGAVVGSGPNDVWVANGNGEPLHHWDGASWTHYDAPGGAQLVGLARAGKSYCAIGEQGAILFKP